MPTEMREVIGDQTRVVAAPAISDAPPKPGTKQAFDQAKKRREEEGRKKEVRVKRSRK